MKVEVTQGNTKLDIGTCALSLQKLVAIFTLLFKLTYTKNYRQRISLIDEPEALLHESVADKLFQLLYTRCRKENIQLIVTIYYCFLVTGDDLNVEVLFMTPNGPKSAEVADDDKDKESTESCGHSDWEPI